MKKIIKRIFIVLLFLIIAGIAVLSAFNYYVVSSAGEYILDKNQFEDFGADYILILGAHVRPDGSLSDMLEDRMQTGVDLYKQKAAFGLLVTGDSENADEYDETKHMAAFAVDCGVASEDIMIDPVGLSTYDSIKRASKQMQGTKIIIITQKYHLFRAVYIARQLGLDAYGCDSALRDYGNSQIIYNVREWLARFKDVIYIKSDHTTKYDTEIPFTKYNVTVE